MFRITKIFENASLAIYKIEGKIADESLQVWTDELETIQKQSGRQHILDFSNVWSISAKALGSLMANLSNGIFVMNPSIEVRNTLHASGLSAKVLE
jgi:anti-anti-sigma regulatory factor